MQNVLLTKLHQQGVISSETITELEQLLKGSVQVQIVLNQQGLNLAIGAKEVAFGKDELATLAKTTFGSTDFDINDLDEPADIREVAKQVLKSTATVQDSLISVQKLAAQKIVLGTTAVALTNLDGNTALTNLCAIHRAVVCTGSQPSAICFSSKGVDVASLTTMLVAFAKIASFVQFAEVNTDCTATQSVKSDNFIACVGQLTDAELTQDLKSKGDLIFLLGESKDDVTGSLYLNNCLQTEIAHGSVDITKEESVTFILSDLNQKGLINAAKSVSRGGVYRALVDMSISNDLGFDIEADGEVRMDSFLFGEYNGRAIVTVSEDNEDEFIEYISTIELPSTLLGHVTKGKLMIDGEHYGFITDARALI
ncbi:MAG TPA: AIR synthase-related protein [Taishania sp.]|nr:AIR synthase-related protein [Taishania sp.]